MNLGPFFSFSKWFMDDFYCAIWMCSLQFKLHISSPNHIDLLVSQELNQQQSSLCCCPWQAYFLAVFFINVLSNGLGRHLVVDFESLHVPTRNLPGCNEWIFPPMVAVVVLQFQWLNNEVLAPCCSFNPHSLIQQMARTLFGSLCLNLHNLHSLKT